MKAKINLLDGLNLDIFSDRFELVMKKEEFKYRIINCLAYVFSQHVNGFFKMAYLDVILSLGMSSLWVSKESSDYFFNYSMELLSDSGFISFKQDDNRNCFFKSNLSQDDFNVACSELAEYYSDKEDVDKMLNVAIEDLDKMLELDHKNDRDEIRREQ